MGRTLYTINCCAGQDISWQWAEDQNLWKNYPMDVQNTLEISYQNKVYLVDLQSFGYTHIVDINSMIQQNVRTGFTRKVQRLSGHVYNQDTNIMYPNSGITNPNNTSQISQHANNLSSS